MKIDQNCRYRHVARIRRKEGAVMVAGISDHAQESLGDIVFVELPAVARSRAGRGLRVVESVKAASDLYMPMSGTITEVNGALEGDPALVNKDPYGAGWMIKFTPSARLRVGGPARRCGLRKEAGKE